MAPLETDADADLVRAVRAGDAGRFAEVVRRFDAGVRRVVARIVRDPAGREEAVQQAFYLAFRGLPSLREPDRLALTRAETETYHGRRFLHLQANAPRAEVDGRKVRAVFSVTFR